MRKVEFSDETWSRLLSLRGGSHTVMEDMVSDGRQDDAAFALYGPIAQASGSFVLAQVGQSLDGRVATPAGDARDISGPDGLAHLHRCRALVDAVIVGISTVKLDDPRLSVRMVKGPDPVRVVIDCKAALTGDEGIFRDGGAPVILFQAEDAPRNRYEGVEVIRLKRHDHGLHPRAILEALSDRALSRILVEGGARTIARFMEADLVDRLHVAISPIIIGSGPSGISLSPIEHLKSARRPKTDVYSLGSDIVFDCSLKAQPALDRQGEKVSVADHA